MRLDYLRFVEMHAPNRKCLCNEVCASMVPGILPPLIILQSLAKSASASTTAFLFLGPTAKAQAQ
jgi:hypothetical protein